VATTALYPGAVESVVNFGTDIPPVGPPPQWNDADDATSATVYEGTSEVFAQSYLDPVSLPASPTSLTYHVRASTDCPVTPPFLFETGVFSDDLSVFMLGVDTLLFAQAEATPAWYTRTVDIPDPDAFAATLAAGTLKLNIAQEGSTSGDVWTYIHEAYVVVTHDDGVTPVARLWPRDDGRGITSAPRIVPASKATRIFGGYQ